MWVEALEPRRLLSGVHEANAFPTTLGISLLGSYHGEWKASRTTTAFAAASMVITRESGRGFRGTMLLDQSRNSVQHFSATLSTYRARGAFGPGYYAVFHYNSAHAHLLLRGAILPGEDVLVAGSTALSFQMTGTLEGGRVSASDEATVSLFPDPQKNG